LCEKETKGKMRERVCVFLVWLVAASVSGPVGILLHELGHYTVAVVSGFPDAKLSFASVSYRDGERFWQTLAGGDRPAAASIYPLQRAGLMAAAGPAVTALLIVSSVLILATRTVTDVVGGFLAGLALIAGVRSFTGVYYVLFVRPKYPDARPFFDEINISRAFDIPVDWIAWSSSALVVFAWIIVIPKLTPNRWLKIPAAVVGPVLGILLWSQIGPFILP
jgi:hypothetical protein